MRSTTRARWRITQQLEDVMPSSRQMASVSSPSTSRLKKTRPPAAGRRPRQRSNTSQNRRCSSAASGSFHACGGERQCPVSSSISSSHASCSAVTVDSSYCTRARSATRRRCRSITLKRRMEVSHVRSVERRSKRSMPSSAARSASCTASSASSASRNCESA